MTACKVLIKSWSRTPTVSPCHLLPRLILGLRVQTYSKSLTSYYLIVLHSTYLTAIWITLLCRQPLDFCSCKIFRLLYFLLLLYNCALGWVVALYTFRISTETSPLTWSQYLVNFGSTSRKTNRCFYISSHRPLEPFFDLMWRLIDSLLQQLVPVKSGGEVECVIFDSWQLSGGILHNWMFSLPLYWMKQVSAALKGSRNLLNDTPIMPPIKPH